MNKYKLIYYDVITTDISSETDYAFSVDVEMKNLSSGESFLLNLNLVSIDRIKRFVQETNIYWDIKMIICEDYVESKCINFIENRLNSIVEDNRFLGTLIEMKLADNSKKK